VSAPETVSRKIASTKFCAKLARVRIPDTRSPNTRSPDTQNSGTSSAPARVTLHHPPTHNPHTQNPIRAGVCLESFLNHGELIFLSRI
jgi:hypothetical protein